MDLLGVGLLLLVTTTTTTTTTTITTTRRVIIFLDPTHVYSKIQVLATLTTYIEEV